MTTYLRSPLTLVWVLLVAVTFVSWWVGARAARDGAAISLPVTTVVVLIALVKARLVFWHFMEVRTGPSWLRAACGSWLVGVAVTLVALYAYRLQAERFQ
jgi:hypothetical protein